MDLEFLRSPGCPSFPGILYLSLWCSLKQLGQAAGKRSSEFYVTQSLWGGLVPEAGSYCTSIEGLPGSIFSTLQSNTLRKLLKKGRLCLGSRFEGTAYHGGKGIVTGRDSHPPAVRKQSQVNTGAQLTFFLFSLGYQPSHTQGEFLS